MANIHEHAVLTDILEPKGSGFVGHHGDDFLLANDPRWIGFSDTASEGSWVWSSGLSVSYTNWNSGEPSGGTEDCGHIYSDLWSVVGRWNDHPCSNQQSYVCEYR